jgi:hypothetical protein
MSINYTIDEDHGIAFALWDGIITRDEWLTHVRQLVADPAWPPSRGLHLSDLRSAHLDLSLDAAAQSEGAAVLGSHRRIRELKAAIVAGPSYAPSRLFEDLIAPHQALVFAVNSLTPACDWLGIDVAYAEQALASLRLSSDSR